MACFAPRQLNAETFLGARIGVKTPPDASCEKSSLAHLVAGFVDPDRSFAITAELEHQDPSDLPEVFHGSGAQFTTGDSGKRFRE